MPKIRMNSLNHHAVYPVMSSWLKQVEIIGDAAIQPVKNVRQSIRWSSVQPVAKNIPMENFVKIVLME